MASGRARGTRSASAGSPRYVSRPAAAAPPIFLATIEPPSIYHFSLTPFHTLYLSWLLCPLTLTLCHSNLRLFGWTHIQFLPCSNRRRSSKLLHSTPKSNEVVHA